MGHRTELVITVLKLADVSQYVTAKWGNAEPVKLPLPEWVEQPDFRHGGIGEYWQVSSWRLMDAWDRIQAYSKDHPEYLIIVDLNDDDEHEWRWIFHDDLVINTNDRPMLCPYAV